MVLNNYGESEIVRYEKNNHYSFIAMLCRIFVGTNFFGMVQPKIHSEKISIAADSGAAGIYRVSF